MPEEESDSLLDPDPSSGTPPETSGSEEDLLDPDYDDYAAARDGIMEEDESLSPPEVTSETPPESSAERPEDTPVEGLLPPAEPVLPPSEVTPSAAVAVAEQTLEMARKISGRTPAIQPEPDPEPPQAAPEAPAVDLEPIEAAINDVRELLLSAQDLLERTKAAADASLDSFAHRDTPPSPEEIANACSDRVQETVATNLRSGKGDWISMMILMFLLAIGAIAAAAYEGSQLHAKINTLEQQNADAAKALDASGKRLDDLGQELRAASKELSSLRRMFGSPGSAPLNTSSQLISVVWTAEGQQLNVFYRNPDKADAAPVSTSSTSDPLPKEDHHK